MTKLNNKVLPENKIVEKKDVVELFGTEKQKESYKKNKKISVGMKKSLEKTLEQYYESLEEVVNPENKRQKAYKLGALRNEVTMRNDNRTNVHSKSDLTSAMEFLVLHQIYHRNFEVEPLTAVGLLQNFGLISGVEYNMYLSNNSGALSQERLVSASNYIDGLNVTDSKGRNDYSSLFNEYQKHVRDLSLRLDTILNRCEKHKLIDYNKRYFIIVKHDGQDKIAQISDDDYQLILDFEAKLRAKYDVTVQDLMYKKNSKDVIGYNNELNYHFFNCVQSLYSEDKMSLQYKLTKKTVVKKYYGEKRYDDYAKRYLTVFKNANREDYQNYLNQLESGKELYLSEKQKKIVNDANKKQEFYDNGTYIGKSQYRNREEETVTNVFYDWLNQKIYAEKMNLLSEPLQSLLEKGFEDLELLTKKKDYYNSVDELADSISQDKSNVIEGHEIKLVLNLNLIKEDKFYYSNETDNVVAELGGNKKPKFVDFIENNQNFQKK